MLKAIILAAGAGTRMKSKKPKVLHEVCGISMIEHVLRASESAGVSDSVVVIGHQAEEVRQKLAGMNLEFALQLERLGTGHAAMQAMGKVPNEGTVLVLCGDTPLVRGETLAGLIRRHNEEENSVTVLTTSLDNPFGYGRIIKDDEGRLVGIVEEKDADAEEKSIKEINSGIYCFDVASLKESLNGLENQNSQSEYYLTDTVGILRGFGKRTGTYEIDDSLEILGVNNKVQLSTAEQIMKSRINHRHMLAGVTIMNPNDTTIGIDVEIEPDTVVLPGSQLKGATSIGSDCEIGPYAILENSTIGMGTTIRQSTVLESSVGNDAKIGPYAYLRPGSKIENNVKLGDFVEVKNSTIGEGSKASHLAYIGDADIGKRVNISCGVVFVNYDGKNKHRTKVGDDVFIGCNVNLVAPVIVKNKAYVAAGTTVTETVPEGALCIGRSRQENKENWVERKWSAEYNADK
ncbi:MAG TPA: bifunctional UDP-N-acetylglucosamine diphosphorylase/glucosamine-1-phosphate N-acetyltransferase GlmU [Clostridia bacterium]|nr:bifunctional UDP-N-acetylglucosamine diphosphorylase/glucosamine-1-phosphate N-acetyltransferase GlmU [Clostridia bacterium]